MTSTAPVFAWRKAYEVNVPRIDAQHKKLVALLSDLQQAMQAGNGQMVVRRVLNELSGYAAWHFQDEEQMMRNARYPELQIHCAEHEQFAARVSKFIADIEAGNSMMTVKVLQYVRDWLFLHIQNSDRRFAAYHLSRT